MSPSFLDLPLDVGTLILEHALEERSNAFNLAAVCKSMQPWAERILHRHVVLHDFTSLGQFEYALRSRKSLPHVKVIRCLHVPEPGLLAQTCPSLECLCIFHNNVFRLAGIRGSTSLSRLIIMGPLIYVNILAANPALLANITHLAFTSDIPTFRTTPDHFATLLPRLSHFTCSYFVNAATQHQSLQHTLSLVLKCTSVRLVIVRMMDYLGTWSDQAMERALVSVEEIRDPRVALFRGTSFYWKDASFVKDELWVDQRVASRTIVSRL